MIKKIYKGMLLYKLLGISQYNNKGGIIMGLFGKSNGEKERKELKGQIDKLMKDYDKEKIDGETYLKKMMDITTTQQKKNK